jgi:hypothetical protein
MAKRHTITIDGRNYPIYSDSTIRTVLQAAGVENPPSVVSNGEVITPSDYDRPAPPHGMITNPTPIEKGATLCDRLLDQEFKLIAHFLGEFPGRPRSISPNHKQIAEHLGGHAPCVRIDVASLKEILCEPKGAKVGPR